MKRLSALILAGLLAAPVPAQAQTRLPGTLDFDLLSEATEDGVMEATFRIHNPTENKVEDLQINSRRNDAVSTTEQAQEELAAGAYPYNGASQSIGSIDPGETKEVTFKVPLSLGQEPTLAMTEPGNYPLQFTLTGMQEGQANSFADERMIFEFNAEKAPSAETEDAADLPEEPNALTVIYPITSEINIVPGETGGESLILSDDHLAEELREGGRLDKLLDSYLDHDLKGAGCVALDPALVDTVNRMAEGYTVNDTRPSIAERPKRLRDSWFNDDASQRGKPGTGAADAKAWIERLQNLQCHMPLPWANTDINAVAHVNNDFLTYEALNRTYEDIVGKPTSTLLLPSSGYVNHKFKRPALVANNTGWVGQAATFDASLGSLLNPGAGYTNPFLRYDFAQDSPASQALTSAASVSVAASEGDVVAKLPNYLSPETGEQVLDTATKLLDAGKVRPRAVTDLPLEETDRPLGTPYEDESAFSDADIVRVEQQARYTDELTNIMVNDPAIAMTRYDFTLPLRRDLLVALSGDFNDRLSKQSEVLRTLRSSVSLIPPGNVYTRVSESSPLLIVAENGLPLPVDASLIYESETATLNTPSRVRIPAKGSITVSMTANMPNVDRTNISLWLATPSKQAISEPVNIAVQTRAGIVSVYGVGAIAALTLILALLFRLGRRKKKSS
ncbi:DUF6049 family protein [Corynebacterium striatum]